MKMKIDLGDFASKKQILLAGRTKGEVIAAKVNLKAMESGEGPIVVFKPDRIVHLNGSFFLGLFGDAIRRLGEAGFRAKYQMLGIPADIVEWGIIRALRAKGGAQ